MLVYVSKCLNLELYIYIYPVIGICVPCRHTYLNKQHRCLLKNSTHRLASKVWYLYHSVYIIHEAGRCNPGWRVGDDEVKSRDICSPAYFKTEVKKLHINVLQTSKKGVKTLTKTLHVVKKEVNVTEHMC